MRVLVTSDNYSSSMEAISNRPMLAVDTETTGLKIWHEDRMVGISVYNGQDAYYFPFRHQLPPNLPEPCLDPLLKAIERTPKTVYFNAPYDLKALGREGMTVPEDFGLVEDVILAAHLLNENEPTLKLKFLGDKYLGPGASLQEQELVDKLKARGLWSQKTEGKDKMWMLSALDVYEYADQDVIITWNLQDFYIPHLRAWKLYDIYLEVNDYQIATIRMERIGVHVDRELMREYSSRMDPVAAAARERLGVLAGYPINPGSPKQLSAMLQVKSTAAEILEAMMDREDWRSPIAKDVLEYRHASKAKGTYYDKWDLLADVDGQLHGNLWLTGTISGRLSCSDPNLQAVPRYNTTYPVKDVITARSPENILVSADLSQAEMRLAAHHAGEERMAAYLIAGNDIHAEVARANNIPRDYAKRINFGIIYGLGSGGLSQKLHIPVQEAKNMLTAYHKSYPGFRALYRRMEVMAERQGYIRMWTGRVRHYGPAQEPHKAMSNLIQGGVAEIARIAITRLHRELRGEGVDLLMMVHDDVWFEMPRSSLHRVLPEIKRLMEDFEFSVPVVADIKAGPSLGKMTHWNPKEGWFDGPLEPYRPVSEWVNQT